MLRLSSCLNIENVTLMVKSDAGNLKIVNDEFLYVNFTLALF